MTREANQTRTSVRKIIRELVITHSVARKLVMILRNANKYLRNKERRERERDDKINQLLKDKRKAETL